MPHMYLNNWLCVRFSIMSQKKVKLAFLIILLTASSTLSSNIENDSRLLHYAP